MTIKVHWIYSSRNVKNRWEIFFLKSHAKNLQEKLVPKIKTENIAGPIMLNFVQFVLVICPSRRLPKYIETKVLATNAFLKDKKEVWN